MFVEALALLLALQAAPGDDIVVRGKRLTPETARQYVNEISRPVEGQLPMFRNPVCPGVVGMSAEQADLVAARVRRVVKHVGVPVAEAGCGPNLWVIVVDDSQKFVAELARQKPEYFAEMNLHEKDRLLRDTATALAWSSVQTQNEDGNSYAAFAPGRSALDSMNSGSLGSAGAANAPMPTTSGGGSVQRNSSASIIKSSTRQSILKSYVVLEAAEVRGKSPVQIADYATMRALAAAQPPQQGATVDTILALFNQGPEIPLSATVPDLAYLKALYSAPPTMNNVQQLNRLTKAILKASGGRKAQP
jgi:hypothetical protein